MPKRFVGKFYSEAEVRALLAAAKDDILYIPIVLAAYYGVRRSEALEVASDRLLWLKRLVEHRLRKQAHLHPAEGHDGAAGQSETSRSSATR